MLKGAISIVFIFCFVAVFSFFDMNPFRSEATVYFGQCIEQAQEGKCPGTELASYSTHYRIDELNRSVIYWSDGRPPRKYDNCAIVDVKNWSCTMRVGKPDEIAVSMTHGDLVQDEPNSSFWPVFRTHFYPVTKFRWWTLQLQEHQKRQWSRS